MDEKHALQVFGHDEKDGEFLVGIVVVVVVVASWLDSASPHRSGAVLR